jgi:hypothetical protein
MVVVVMAIQSISILIQNVSGATSLYFLLSNDIVNELIQLPIESYRHAAAAVAGVVTNAANDANAKKGGGGERQININYSHHVMLMSTPGIVITCWYY